MKKPKLLFITHVGNPGGAEIKMLELLKLSEFDSQVMLLAQGSLKEKLEAQAVPVFVAESSNSLKTFRREGGLISLIKVVPAVLKMVLEVKKTAVKHDVIICMSQKSFFLAALGKVFFRKPIIWFMNDIVSREHFSKLSIWLIKTFSKIFADLVVLNSEASLHAWHEAGAKSGNETVIYSGVCEKTVEQARQIAKNNFHEKRNKFCTENEFLVGVFGRISEWKGQHIVIEALATVPNSHLVIVGGVQFDELDYEKYLHDKVSELGLSDRVHFLGHVDSPLEAMMLCDVIVHSSIAPEPFGRVVVEAMMSGKPVIASRAGGVLDILEEKKTGLFFEPGNDNELTGLLLSLKNQDINCDEMVASAKLTAIRNYSAKKMRIVFNKEVYKLV